MAHKFNEVRGAYFGRYFAGVAQFAFKHWTKSELGTADVIPYFSPETMTFEQWIESAEAPSLPKDDPRWELNSAMPFNQVDPITVGRNSGARVLLDGYHRACRFWGKRDAALTLAVYLPV